MRHGTEEMKSGKGSCSMPSQQRDMGSDVSSSSGVKERVLTSIDFGRLHFDLTQKDETDIRSNVILFQAA
jgi:hypothetical protein